MGPGGVCAPPEFVRGLFRASPEVGYRWKCNVSVTHHKLAAPHLWQCARRATDSRK